MLVLPLAAPLVTFVRQLLCGQTLVLPLATPLVTLALFYSTYFRVSTHRRHGYDLLVLFFPNHGRVFKGVFYGRYMNRATRPLHNHLCHKNPTNLMQLFISLNLSFFRSAVWLKLDIHSHLPLIQFSILFSYFCLRPLAKDQGIT